VAVAAGRHGSKETYTYAIPEGLAPVVGQQVWVPFGRRDEHGYVVGFSDTPPAVAAKAIKNLDKAPPLFTWQVELAYKMRDRYWATLGECLQAMLPPRIRSGGVPVGDRQRKFSGILQSLRQAQGSDPGYRLSNAQEEALASFRANQAVLLLGVTGSGKTEIYLRAAQETVAQGKQVLVLSPEAAPTPQLIERFAARFPGRVAILSSGLTDLERAQEWARVRSGQALVVIGNRSAVFAPLPQPGLICIDEEGSSSYQEERRPRYNASGVAWDLAQVTDAKLILGSATPSLGSYQAAKEGKMALVRMDERIVGAGARVELVDMRSEAALGRKGAISHSLEEALESALGAQEQVILLSNRKRPSPYAFCHACGKPLDCDNCSVAMLQDASGEGVVCVYCGLRKEMPLLCPSCHKPEMGWGGKAQKLDGWLASRWPSAKVASHSAEGDLDAHMAVYEALQKQEIDILVGTQSMGHGFDLPHVGLVGILNADAALHSARYDSAETCFGFVVQAAGRAGRGDKPARVLVQTLRPEHYSLRFAAQTDYEGFAQEELAARAALEYPPFAEMATLTCSNKSQAKAQKLVAEAVAKLQVAMAKGGIADIEVLGPTAAALSKLRGEWRWQFSLKGQDLARLRGWLPSEHGWQTELDRGIA
jgi:primosomal protein N' (replication factor Y)